jgi:hypothetical protein
MLALAICLGIRNHVGRRQIMLLWFKLGLILTLMDLLETRNIILMLLG